MLNPAQDRVNEAHIATDLIAGARFQAEIAKQGLATLAQEPLPEIPGYQIRREVHRGGQGVVYEGVHEVTTQVVAIKVLHSGSPASESAVHRFRSEVEALASLKHPNVVRLHDGGCTHGRYFLVMDLVKGQPLNRYLCAEELGLDQGLRLFQGICRGVEAAHQRGIIHRDLKPSNVLVDEAGTPHIVDFGLARILCEDAERSAWATAEGRFVGSLAWAAPEQVTGRSEDIDVRSDVHALGLLLFLILTGEPPRPECGSLHELVECIATGEPPRPSCALPGTPGELDAIVLKCLEKPKNLRYGTASGLLDDISRYLRREPVSAAKYSTAELARKFLRRHWVLSTVAAVIVFIVAGYAVTVTHLLGRAQVAERAEERRHLETLETLAFTVREVSARLRELPGGREVRDAILLDVLRRLQNLETEYGDPETSRGIAQAKLELGDVALTLGNHEKAEALFEGALRLFSELQGGGTDENLWPEVSLAIVRRGDVHKARGEFEQARRLYEEALEIDERLAAEEPGDLVHVRRLVWSYERCGWIAKKLGNRALAAERFRKQQELAERLVQCDGTEPVHLHALLSSCGQQAGFLPPGEDQCPILLRGLHAGEELLRMLPNHAEYRHRVASTYCMLVLAELNTGKLEQVVEHANRAEELAGVLFDLDEESTAWQGLMALCLFVKGKAVASTGDPEAGILHVKKAVGLRQKLFEANPSIAALYLNDLVTLSRMQWDEGQGHDAAESARQALAVTEQVMANPAVESDALRVASSFLRTANPESLRNPDLAAQAARRSVELPDGNNVHNWLEFAEALWEIGDVLGAEEAIAKAEGMVEPDNTGTAEAIAKLRDSLTP